MNSLRFHRDAISILIAIAALAGLIVWMLAGLNPVR